MLLPESGPFKECYKHLFIYELSILRLLSQTLNTCVNENTVYVANNMSKVHNQQICFVKKTRNGMFWLSFNCHSRWRAHFAASTVVQNLQVTGDKGNFFRQLKLKHVKKYSVVYAIYNI